MKKRILKTVKYLSLLYILMAIVGGVALAEFSLRLPRHHIQEAQRNTVLARVAGLHASLEDISQALLRNNKGIFRPQVGANRFLR